MIYSFFLTFAANVCYNIAIKNLNASRNSRKLDALSDEAFDAFCSVSGGCRSVILALCVLDGVLPADQAFDLAVLEETYQNQFWTADEEAMAARENRKQAVIRAAEKLKG